jgi:hypothetical protein
MGCSINEEKIISLAVARLKRKLAYGHAPPGGQIGSALI